MLKKVRVDQKGDTTYLPGQFVDRHEFRRINDEVIGRGRARGVRGDHPRHHQGVAGDGLVPLGGLLPGDHEGAHRRGARGQDRPPRGPEGERDHREADPGGHGPQALPHDRDRAGRAAPPRDRRRRPARGRRARRRARASTTARAWAASARRSTRRSSRRSAPASARPAAASTTSAGTSTSRRRRPLGPDATTSESELAQRPPSGRRRRLGSPAAWRSSRARSSCPAEELTLPGAGRRRSTGCGWRS